MHVEGLRNSLLLPQRKEQLPAQLQNLSRPCLPVGKVPVHEKLTKPSQDVPLS